MATTTSGGLITNALPRGLIGRLPVGRQGLLGRPSPAYLPTGQAGRTGRQPLPYAPVQRTTGLIPAVTSPSASIPDLLSQRDDDSFPLPTGQAGGTLDTMTTGGLSYDDLLSLLVFGGMPLPTGQAGIGQAGSGISEAEPAGLTTGPAAGLLPVPAAPKAAEPGKPVSHEDFLSSLLPMAESAGAEIGIDPKMLVAQAALETGWGRHMAGRNNLFNIKAGRGWSGDTSEVSTTEYRDGAPAKERAKFRAYESPEESFADYARLITGSKRYEGALASSGDPERYIRNIHNAGYATDPEYADKVLRIYRSIT